MLQDVVTCIRLHTTIDNAGFQKERHADRFLKRARRNAPAVPAITKHAVRRTTKSPSAAASRSTN